MPRSGRKFFWSFIFSSVAIGAWGGIIVGTQPPPLSRDMQLGIFYFKKGEDSEAMDRFIEVLNGGNPAERVIANKYLNRITRRMSGTKPGSEETSAQNPAAPTRIKIVQSSPLSGVALQQEIKGQIQNLTVSGLARLKRIHGIVVLRKKDGRPWAAALPSNLLFKKRITFTKNADQILSDLALVSYGEGKAKIFVFPEGAALGDVKVGNMRRAVAVADSLVASGISPSRVQSELLTGSSYRIPSPLLSFKGIILVFAYHATLDLKAPPDEDGPPLSMGLSSSRFLVDKGEGVLIEFSIEKPQSGVRFWKFRILGPENAKPRTIEEVVGSGSVFHQVYWDGRKNYSGSPEPSGFYECLLTAEDGAGRTRAIHRWVELVGPPEAQKGPSKRRKAVKPVRPNPIKRNFPGHKKISYVQLHANHGKKKKFRAKALLGANVISFQAGSYQTNREMENKILALARGMAKNKKARYNITGYAKPAEKNAKNLCRQRAQIVAGLLINKYGINFRRLKISGHVLNSKGDRVIVFTRAVAKKRSARKRGRKSY